MNVSFDLRGRRVLVVGGGSGIGRATALLALESGAEVWVFDRDVSRIAADAAAHGPALRTTTLDLRDAAATHAATAEVGERWGACDLVHVNAGISEHATFSEATESSFLALMEVNLFAAWRIAHDLFPAMVAAGRGVFVFTGSPHAYRTSSDASSYAISKGGLSAMMRSIAMEGAPHGVRAVTVMPGAILTPLLREDAAVHSAGDGSDVIARWSTQRPVGRLGEPEEIAAAVLFLGSDASGFTTGTELYVDGGMFAALAD